MIISFNNYVDFHEICRRHNLETNMLVTIQIGYDEKIYFLFNSNIPERIDGMFVPTESNSAYIVLILDVDWNTEKIINERCFPLGTMKMNYHFIQSIEDKLLLVASRCSFNNGDPDKNAVITDLQGNIVSEFCLGDGINKCLVHKDNSIVTAYFDEGIFGNYGWNEPLGACGLKIWSADGKNGIWESDRDIYDCYAMNIGRNGNIWYYYYNKFKLICTDRQKEIEYDPKISGADEFILTDDGLGFIMDSGYDNHSEFLAFQIKNDAITKTERISFEFKGVLKDLVIFSTYGSKAIFLGSDSRLYIKKFDSLW
ncbi:hypothetical protein UYO_2271 [Lachnospiraceae bacterium JC7]|nr:hypothetical protein UYO_2271 [Lachnospiraceae bacterium JC7]